MTAATALTLRAHFHVARPSRRIELRPGRTPEPAPGANVPRVARLLALAHRYQRLLDENEAADYAELARVTGVTRARVSQIMDLLLLAPDLQEEILFLPGSRNREPITAHDLRPIAAMADWREQRAKWASLIEPIRRRRSQVPA